MANISTEVLIQTIFFILWSLSVYLFKRLLNDMDTRITKNETDIRDFKDNYIDRFQLLNDRIQELERKAIGKINDVQIEIIKEIGKLHSSDK